MKILRAREMKEIDNRASTEYGIPSILLMENAGLRVVEVVEDILQEPTGKKVVVLVGKGNNGGDGLVVARHLINSNVNVETFLLADASGMTGDAYLNYKILSKMTDKIYPLFSKEDLNRLQISLFTCDLIVDSIYGIGFKGSLSDFETRVVKMINLCRSPVVAVDIPSGVDADTGRVHGEAVKAFHTVTFAAPKLGLVIEPGKDYAGTLTVADISIPTFLLQDDKIKANLITEDMIRPLIKPRLPESHKGTYGHALVIGGSAGLTGAVIMASYAALRSGAGLVTAALPESLVPVVETALIEVMTAPLAENHQMAIALEALPAVENLLGTASVCAIGPGMSGHPEANGVVRFVLEKAGIPVIIDADGLNALQGDVDVLKDRQIPVILTPHPGEMARLTGKSIKEIQANRVEIARHFAQEWGVGLVLKGNKTVIASPSGEIYINITGNPGMATAGSGDVLCGMIAGLIAQGLKPKEAAIAGVYLHGLIGDYVAEIRGQRGLTAGDLINGIPDILRRFEQF